jgi:hypothetical protein
MILHLCRIDGLWLPSPRPCAVLYIQYNFVVLSASTMSFGKILRLMTMKKADDNGFASIS